MFHIHKWGPWAITHSVIINIRYRTCSKCGTTQTKRTYH